MYVESLAKSLQKQIAWTIWIQTLPWQVYRICARPLESLSFGQVQETCLTGKEKHGVCDIRVVIIGEEDCSFVSLVSLARFDELQAILVPRKH